MTLEQELVRAEAENLVAEAQLTNVTRQKLKEAYQQQIDAVMERSERQAILAKHARRLLELLDDTPVIPGAERLGYDNERAAREVLLDAEEELVNWQPKYDEIPTSRLESNLLPSHGNRSIEPSDAGQPSLPGDADESGGKEETSSAPPDPKILESTS